MTIESPHSIQPLAATPSTAATVPRWSPWIAAATVLMLQACGGGGSGDAGTPTTSPSSVSGSTVDRLSYGQTSIFTLTGTNLSTGVSFSATGCDGLTVLAGGSATQQQVSCTPNKALSVRLAATVGTSEIYSATSAVPKPQVTLTTSAGSIVIELDPAKVQATVDNFLTYVRAGFYNGTIFHRVAPLSVGSNYIVQGGGFTGVAGNALTAQTGQRAPIALEVNKGLSNLRGTIAMARTGVLDSATSQFYFNAADNVFLDTSGGGYAVFGQVTSGLAVIDAISAVPTRNVGGNAGVPVTDVLLQTAAQTL